MRRRSTGLAIAATATGAVYATRRRNWRSVRLTDLLGRHGGPYSVARAAVPGVGIVGTAAGRAFLLDEHRLSWLTPLGTASDAHAIGPTGVIVGGTFSEGLGRRGFMVSGGAVHELPPLPNAAESVAHGLAEGDLPVGVSIEAGGRSRACRWRGTTPIDLTSAAVRAAAAVGAAGEVTVGWAEIADGRRVATAWRGTEMATLETPTGAGSVAHAVNRRGDIVGAVQSADGTTTAVLWKPALTLLGGLGGGRSEALAIDDTGVIAGHAETAEGRMHAVIWRDARPTDLGTLGGVTSVAHGLDGAGKVVGVASTGAGPVGFPWRPGGWSWEDHAFIGDVPG